MDKPAANPWVCISCGAGVERLFFVDLGVDTQFQKIDEHDTQYHTEGVVYLCSECITSMIVEFNRKLTPYLSHYLISRGFLMETNKGEIKTLQDEVFMLRDLLNAKDVENQEMRFKLQSRLDMENGTISPPESTTPTADELVDKMLGTDTDGTSTGTGDPVIDGRDSNTEGTDSESNSDESSSTTNESATDADSLAITHAAFALGHFNTET
jgi:hypothetical protein